MEGGPHLDYRTRIRNVRQDRDFNQAQIGDVIQKSQQGYSHIENGRAELKIDDLVLLCKFYDLSADYLIGLHDFPVSYRNVIDAHRPVDPPGGPTKGKR